MEKSKKIKEVWLRGVGDRQTEIDQVLHYISLPLTQKLISLIEQKLNEVSKGPDYDNPNWAYKQAHMNGYEQALNQVLQLLNKDHKKYE